MSIAEVVAGVVFVALGVAGAVWPYEVAQLGELVDAIGRRPAGPVEPAGWNVWLTRVLGGLCVLGGLWLIVMGLATP